MNKDKLKEIIILLEENGDKWEYVSCNQMVLILKAILESER